MKKSGKQVLLFGGILIVAFAVWTALIQMVDVQPLGQNEGVKFSVSMGKNLL